VISLLSQQKGIKEMGGTMRLGAYTFKIKPQSKAHRIYKRLTVSERHRHRYEFNNQYRSMYEERGFVISGSLPADDLCEVAEIQSHPWMIGVQFHPEFKSKPLAPHPLFIHFIGAALKHGAISRN
jgi:CTP synthase